MVASELTHDQCPHCRLWLRDDVTVTCGPFSHHPRLGLRIDGSEADVRRALHNGAGALMRAGGRVITDAQLMRACRNDDVDGPCQASMIGHQLRAAIRTAGHASPFTRIRSVGYAWTLDEAFGTTRNELRMCPQCGYNLVPEEHVEDGPVSYDPSTRTARIGGIRFDAPPMCHYLIGSLMHARGDIVSASALASHMGTRGEDPEAAVRVIMCVTLRHLRRIGTDVPVVTHHGLGYRWIGEEHYGEPRYHGPILIRQSAPPPEDIRMTDPPERHVCGCPDQGAGIRTGSWTLEAGRSPTHGDITIGGRPGAVVARVMSAAGRPVRAIDMRDLIPTGTAVEAERHLKVLICHARRAAAAGGLTLPIENVHGRGYRWAGDPPETIAPDHDRPCAACAARAYKVVAAGGSDAQVRRHPGLSGRPLMIADLLASDPDRRWRSKDLADVLGGVRNVKIVQQMFVRIRRAYAHAGLPDPVESVYGLGYRWIGGTDAASVATEPSKAIVRRKATARPASHARDRRTTVRTETPSIGEATGVRAERSEAMAVA